MRRWKFEVMVTHSDFSLSVGPMIVTIYLKKPIEVNLKLYWIFSCFHNICSHTWNQWRAKISRRTIRITIYFQFNQTQWSTLDAMCISHCSCFTKILCYCMTEKKFDTDHNLTFWICSRLIIQTWAKIMMTAKCRLQRRCGKNTMTGPSDIRVHLW